MSIDYKSLNLTERELIELYNQLKQEYSNTNSRSNKYNSTICILSYQYFKEYIVNNSRVADYFVTFNVNDNGLTWNNTTTGSYGSPFGVYTELLCGNTENLFSHYLGSRAAMLNEEAGLFLQRRDYYHSSGQPYACAYIYI